MRNLSAARSSFDFALLIAVASITYGGTLAGVRSGQLWLIAGSKREISNSHHSDTSSVATDSQSQIPFCPHTTNHRPGLRSCTPTPSAHLPWWPTTPSRRISVTRRRKGPMKAATVSWWLGIHGGLLPVSRNRYSPDSCLPPKPARLVTQRLLSDSCSPRKRRQSPIGRQTVLESVALAQLFCTNRAHTPALGVGHVR